MAAKKPIDAASSKSFPIFDEFRLRHLPNLHEQMDMIWHYDPCEQTIALSIETKPVLLNQCGCAVIAEETTAASAIEIPLDCQPAF